MERWNLGKSFPIGQYSISLAPVQAQAPPFLFPSVVTQGSSYGSVFPTGYTKLDFIDDRDHTKKVTYTPSDLTGFW